MQDFHSDLNFPIIDVPFFYQFPYTLAVREVTFPLPLISSWMVVQFWKGIKYCFPSNVSIDPFSSESKFTSASTLSYSSKNACLVSSSKRLMQTWIAFVFLPKIVWLHDVYQTTGGNDFFNTTIIEGLTDDVAQSTSLVVKLSSSEILPRIFVSIAGLGYSCSMVTDLSRNASLSTLVPMNLCVLGSFTFGVCGCEYLESFCWGNALSNLLEENSFPFEDRLKAEDFV